MSAYKEGFIERQTKSIISKFTQNYNMVTGHVSQTCLIITPPGELGVPNHSSGDSGWRGSAFCYAIQVHLIIRQSCIDLSGSRAMFKQPTVLKVPKCCTLESPERSFKPPPCKTHPNSNENLWEWA